MSTPAPKTSRAGGAILAFTVTAGALIGAIKGQPSIGIVAGIAIGVAVCVGLFFYDRRG
jgi:uncharacterized membrane protein (UPF0136 family)